MTEIQITFENDEVVVLNKPVGVMVHADGHSKDPTVVDWFLEQYPGSQGIGEPGFNPKGEELERSGVVHRLDRETSGVMIMAKTQAAFDHLKLQFHNRLVQKEYRAFVYGYMREGWGTIERPIGRSASDFRKRSAERGAKGTLREAVTNWERIGQGEHEGEPFSYLKLKPQTGRTHQLRVHLKALDRPIIGDQLYAGKKLEQSNNLGLDRLALHAHTLALILPDGEDKRFMAPVPESFEMAADRLHDEADTY